MDRALGSHAVAAQPVDVQAMSVGRERGGARGLRVWPRHQLLADNRWGDRGPDGCSWVVGWVGRRTRAGSRAATTVASRRLMRGLRSVGILLRKA